MSAHGQYRQVPSQSPVGAKMPAKPSIQEPKPVIVRTPVIDINYCVNADVEQYIEQIQLWYASGFDGRWQLYDFDHDLTSPVRFVAPGEGIYKFIVVAIDHWGRRSWQSGKGQYENTSNNTISPEAAAQQVVFVDYTKPTLYIRSPRQGLPNYQGTTLYISWTGFDTYLREKPTQLFYEPLGSNQWQLIAPSQNASGQYTWQLPSDLQGPVVIKVVLTDWAGNRKVRSSEIINITPKNPRPIAKDRPAESKITSETITNLVTHTTAQTQVIPSPAAFETTEQSTIQQALYAQAKATTKQSPKITTELAGPTIIIDTIAQEKAGDGRAVADLDSVAVRESFRRGNLHCRRCEWSQAAKAFKETLQKDPSYAKARLHLANVYYKMGQFKQSQQELEKCLTNRDIDQKKVLWNLAQTLLAQDNYNGASDKLWKLLKEDPDDYQSWLLFGDIAQQQGKKSLAIKSWSYITRQDLADAETLQIAKARLRQYRP